MTIPPGSPYTSISTPLVHLRTTRVRPHRPFASNAAILARTLIFPAI
jgi:hypothetical protein